MNHLVARLGIRRQEILWTETTSEDFCGTVVNKTMFLQRMQRLETLAAFFAHLRLGSTVFLHSVILQARLPAE
jgi:hypothetical protein